jgi:hypothetical protein
MQTQTDITNIAVTELLEADLQFNDFPTGAHNFSLCNRNKQMGQISTVCQPEHYAASTPNVHNSQCNIILQMTASPLVSCKA